MCLSVPGKVVELRQSVAVVDFWGARAQVQLSAIDEEVVPGDFVLVHVGFALRRIPPAEVSETLAFFDAILRDRGGKLLADDVRLEIAAGETL